MQLGTKATRLQSEQGQHVLKRTVRRSHQLSAMSIAKDLQTFRIAQRQCVESLMDWVSM
ncbi:unnamed protein product, partial [Staurois parvus]